MAQIRAPLGATALRARVGGECGGAVIEDDIDQLLDLALEDYQAGRLSEAEQGCHRILAREPRDVSALHIYGVIGARTGRTALGIEFLRKVVALEPQSVDALSDLGHLLKSQGQLVEAISIGEKAVELGPGTVAAQNNLGDAYLAANRLDAAIACFERTISLKPDLGVAHYNLGMARQAQGREDEAIAAYRRAIACAPHLVEAQVRLGNVLSLGDKTSEAIACWRKAASMQPASTLGRISLAKALSEEGEVTAAEECLRGAIAADPASADAHSILGELLTRTGRFAEAAPFFEQTIALQPRHTLAYFSLTHGQAITAAERPLLQRMDLLLADRNLADRDRVNLHFALGKALDDLGEYEQAMRHFDEANRIEAQLQKLAGRTPHRKEYAAEIDRIIETYTPEFFARQTPFGCASELPILIVGMPRSGTTLVEQILSSHRKVEAGGELTFWSEQVPALAEVAPIKLDPALTRNLATDYLAVLRGISPAAKRVTDKTPGNFQLLGPIHLIFPQARIIHCRRNPIDTCLSIYFTYFGTMKDFTSDRGDIVFFYEQYMRLMAHWRSALPSNRFLEVDYEALVADRERLKRDIIGYCGLDCVEAVFHDALNRRVIKTASNWQARQPVYTTSVARWRHYEPWLGEFRRFLT